MPESANEIINQTISWIDHGYRVALATVVSTWGSSPRPVGSQLVINEKGHFRGSVSGGCIESFVISEAIDVIENGEPQLLEYGVSDHQAREVLLTCGGVVRVYVERAPPQEDLARLADNGPVARVVNLSTGHGSMVDESSVQGTLQFDRKRLENIRVMLRHDSSGLMTTPDAELFVTSYGRKRKLIIIGAVHITQVLASMARAVGFEVVVVDPRPAFSTAERLPGVTIIRDPVGKAMQRLSLDVTTAIVTLAHDPILDDPALHAALNSDVGYIGCLGSQRTQGLRLNRLRQAGFKSNDLARLHGPVGLDIGGSSPGEIAISILAEIIAVTHGKARK